ncbi:MAG: hypothetical protein RR998_06460 [Oscillospiraceae bacterium]
MSSSARFEIEHKVLPSVLFSAEGGSLIHHIVSTKGAFVCDLYNKFCADDTKYIQSDFVVNPFFVSDDLAVVHVKLPEPERAHLCSSIYILHNTELSACRFFTIESTEDGGLSLGEWTSNEQHNDYGDVTADPAEQIAAIAGILLPNTPKS